MMSAAVMLALATPQSWGQDDLSEPSITLRAGALFMRRQTPDPQILIFDNGANFLDASDFDFGYQPGYEVSGIGALGDDAEFEIRFFDINGMDASVTRDNPVGGGAAYVFDPNAGFGGQLGSFFTSVTGKYDSDLLGAEANGRYLIADGLTLLAGFRYVQLNEKLFFDEIDAGNTLVDIRSENDLYGGQIGAEGRWSIGCLVIDSVVKGCVYQNFTNNDVDLSGLFVVGNTDVQDKDRTVSYGAEASVAASLPLTDHLSLRGGYQVMWLANVAVASEQMRVSDPINAGGTSGRVDSTGDVLFHGAFAGAELTW
jgi:Putative beta barrel porin-7 (BBP7)